MDGLRLSGYCEVCDDELKPNEPGLSPSDDHDKYHFKCMDEGQRERYREELEEARGDFERWMTNVEPLRQEVRSKQGTKVKGKWGHLTARLFGVFKDLFPNGPVSDKVKVVDDIDVSEFGSTNKEIHSFYDSSLYISPRGIGTQSEYRDTADYMEGFKALILMWKYKEEIADLLYSYRDRTKKFLQYIEAVDSVLDWDAHFEHQLARGSSNWVYDSVEFREVGLPDKITFRNSRGVGPNSTESYEGIKVKESASSYYVLPLHESTWTSRIYFRPYADNYYAYKQILPIANEMLDEALEEQEERVNEQDRKVNQVEKEVRTYLAANII